jgi:hypothetical protein
VGGKFMTSKEIFLNKELRYGGFYELAIQVCPSADIKPIEMYTEFVWDLHNVEGPFDFNFNKVEIDFQNNMHRGILHLDNLKMPFMTCNIREEPIETEYNWFNLEFPSAALDYLFGEKYEKEWEGNLRLPKPLDHFIMECMKNLYAIHKFQMALVDFEVSGSHYLEELKKELQHPPRRFYVGKENYALLADTNKKNAHIVER